MTMRVPRPSLINTTEVARCLRYCLPAFGLPTRLCATIELGVTIIDAAVDEKQTTIFCPPVIRDPRCPDCGGDGKYRDTVVRPSTDLPMVGYPLVLQVLHTPVSSTPLPSSQPASGSPGSTAIRERTSAAPLRIDVRTAHRRQGEKRDRVSHVRDELRVPAEAVDELWSRFRSPDEGRH